MRTATFPAVRTSPENRALVESVLRPGETLSTFIEETLHQKAQWRKDDEAFYAKAMQAANGIREGGKTYTLDETITSLRAQIQRARNKPAPTDITTVPPGQRKTPAAPKKTRAAS